MTRKEIDEMKTIMASAKTAKAYSIDAANNRPEVSRTTIDTFVKDAKALIASKKSFHIVLIQS